MEPTATPVPVPEIAAVPSVPAADGETAAALRTPEPRDTLAGALQFREAAPRVAAQPYEFVQRSPLAAPELRKLRSDLEAFLGSLATRLAIYFRTDFALTLGTLETPTYRQFLSTLATPTHVTFFKVEPLRGISLLEISPAFGLAMTDRLMGGPGTPAAARELSEIEVALLDQVAQFITEGWCAQWQRPPELKPVLLGHESDPCYLQTSLPDSTLLVATISAGLGQVTGQLQLAFPYATLEPLLQKLRADLKPPAEAPPAAALPKPGPWNHTLNDVKIAIAAELPGPQLLARAIPQLKVGQVLELPAESGHQVQLRLGGLTRFTGRLGTRDNYWAVEVTHVANA